MVIKYAFLNIFIKGTTTFEKSQFTLTTSMIENGGYEFIQPGQICEIKMLRYLHCIIYIRSLILILVS